MWTSTDQITINAVDKSGRPIKGIVPAGFAQLTDSGIITSFTLLANGYRYGRHFALDLKRNSIEERVRKVLTHLASMGLTMAEREIFDRKTGQRPNWPATFILNGINTNLVSQLERQIPDFTDAELGYHEHTGDIIIEGVIRLS